jgi:GTP-binding protein
MDFRYKRKYNAANGDDGSGSNKTGKDGGDLVIRVPMGTVIREKESGAIVADVSGGEPFRLVRGGSGRRARPRALPRPDCRAKSWRSC